MATFTDREDLYLLLFGNIVLLLQGSVSSSLLVWVEFLTPASSSETGAPTCRIVSVAPPNKNWSTPDFGAIWTDAGISGSPHDPSFFS